nr:hypothetical protein [Tanacetum cinerariifolium]
MVLDRVMWRLFVVVGGCDILRDQRRSCGHFKEQKMDCGAFKKLLGEGVDLTGDEDRGTRMGDLTGVSTSLGGEISSGEKNFQESNIGKKTSMSKRYLVKLFEESEEMLPGEAEK